MAIAPERVSPLIEDLADGRYRVTVAFHDPVAEDVWIIGGLAGAEPGDRRLRRAADGWWERTYELPHGVRTGYWFTRTLVPSGASDVVPDPLNPRRHVYPGDPEIADDEDVETSLIELPGAPDRRWSVEREGVPRGETTLHRFRSERLGNERRVFTYKPAGYDDSSAYPLVVCFDGHAYAHDAYVPLRPCSTT